MPGDRVPAEPPASQPPSGGAGAAGGREAAAAGTEAAGTGEAGGLLGSVFKNANLRRAELSYGISITASTAWVSLLLVLTFRQAGAVGPGIFLLVRSTAGALASPGIAAVAERWRREHVLATGLLLRAAVALLAIAVLHTDMPVGVLYAAGVVEGVGAAAPGAIQYALLPWLASSPSQLIAANALSSVQEVGGIMLGGAIDVILLHLSGSDSVLIAAGVLCLIGMGMLLLIRGVTTKVTIETASAEEQSLSKLGAGVRYLLGAAGPRRVVLALALPLLLTGVAQSFASSVAIDLLKLGASGTPLLVACVGFGGLVGGMASVSLASRRNLVPYLIGGLLLSAVGPVLVAGFPYLADTIVVLVFFGAGIAIQTVSTHSLLQRIVPTSVLGPVVGVTGFLGFAALGGGAIAAAGLNSLVGVRTTLLITGLIAVAAALTVLARMRGLEGADDDNALRRQMVAAPDLFRPLSVAVKTQLARDLSPVDVRVGETVITEGEPGDDFFIIESGTYDVLVDGARVRTLSGGDSFGEIALLFSSLRTATIRATDEGRLWRLGRQSFLGAVTSGRVSR